MFSRLFLLFVVVPALELYLLIKIGQLIGAFETFAIIVVTGLVGSAMAKAEGIAVWTRFNRRLSEGSVPGKEIVDGLIILVSGAFLITPGVLTDVVGLLGLFPPSRALVRSFVFSRIKEHGATSINGVFFQFGSSNRGGGEAGQEETRRDSTSSKTSSTSSTSESPEERETRLSGRAKSKPGYENDA